MNLTGDWTTAPGNDANDGLSPATPKASIRSVLEAYDLRPGDVIRVDAGTYNLLTNIVLVAQDSGVTIEGYHDAVHTDRVAVLDRDSRAGGAFVFELAGADDVTISHLTLRDADWAVRAVEGVDSDRVAVRDNIIDNVNGGIRLDRFNDAAVLASNTIDVSTGVGGAVELYEGAGHAVIGNYVPAFAGGIAIYVTAPGALVADNDITEMIGPPYGGIGIRVDGRGSTPAELSIIRGNFLHELSNVGIQASTNVLIEDNEVVASGGWGMTATGGEIRNNFVHDNANGIQVSGTTVSGNRVVHNAGFGIQIFNSAVVTGNTIYANRVGVQGTGFFSNFSGLIANNLIYQNLEQGVQINVAAGGEVVNNTIVQDVGEAVRVQSGSVGLQVRNNVIAVGAGTAISLAGDSVINFRSDYNNLFVIGSGRLAAVEALSFTSLADWFFEFGQDQHSQTTDPLFVDPDGADNLLGYVGGADHGLDDNFHVQNGSPLIDAGDPSSPFGLEPAPNGGRVNIGADGNTPSANPSPAEVVQVLAPAGLEKFEAGQQVTIRWRSFGLPSPELALADLDLVFPGQSNSVALIAAGTAIDGEFVGRSPPACHWISIINSVFGWAVMKYIRNPSRS